MLSARRRPHPIITSPAQAHPVVGKRIISFVFEVESESEVSLIIQGNTWNYRDDLEKAGVQGQRPEGGGAYIRFMKNVDVSDAESKESIKNLVDLFNKQAIRVAVDPAPEEAMCERFGLGPAGRGHGLPFNGLQGIHGLRCIPWFPVC